jgi:hypothetical protein
MLKMGLITFEASKSRFTFMYQHKNLIFGCYKIIIAMLVYC